MFGLGAERADSPAVTLAGLFARPAGVRHLGTRDWDLVLRVARKEQLLARLGAALEAVPDLSALCPPEVQAMFSAARVYPNLIQARASWELGKVLAATADLGVDYIILKGMGYVRAELPLARGRVFSDLDLLVPESQLAAVEERLLARGWEHHVTDAYDHRYYRQWMHEIPPLRHPARGMEVDIHHRILPRTARLSPDPGPLWEAAIRLGPRLRVLSPPDMVLHCAAHLFADGEIKGGFRDLVDLHQLLCHFAASDDTFWTSLSARARLLGLGRPLYYGLRYCNEWLKTMVSLQVSEVVGESAPSAAVRTLMDWLVGAVLPPHDVGRADPALSAWLLYVRSHWLRMPPGLLAGHLMRKAVRRLQRAPGPGGSRAT